MRVGLGSRVRFQGCRAQGLSLRIRFVAAFLHSPKASTWRIRGAKYVDFRWSPHPVIVTIRDNKDYIRVLLYSYYTTITGWGVLIM